MICDYSLVSNSRFEFSMIDFAFYFVLVEKLQLSKMCAHVMVPFFQRALRARKKKGTITWAQ